MNEVAELELNGNLPGQENWKFIIIANDSTEEGYFDIDVYGNVNGVASTVITTLDKEQATQLRDSLNTFLGE